MRGNGEPLYTLVNPVDDALMRITHVLRGEDLLSSTPRQIALYDALAEIGVSDGTTPRFGHLPYVMGEGNKKLSKRDPQSSLNLYREEGFLPEGLLNYLALLGWSMGEDREFFSKEQMAARVLPRPRQRQPRALRPQEVHGDQRRLDARPARRRAGPPRAAGARRARRPARPGVRRGRADPGRGDPPGPGADGDPRPGRGDARASCSSTRRPSPRTPTTPRGCSDRTPRRSLTAARTALAGLDEWTAPAIEAALRAALIEGLGLKPKVAFGSLRVAVTGRRVSPPLFESIELLGRERTLARIDAALA